MNETVVVQQVVNEVVISGSEPTVTINDPAVSTVHVDAGPNVTVEEEDVTVIVNAVGIQGPAGPQGPSGAAGGSAVVHTQGIPSNVWIINHMFGREPNVVVVIGGESVIADITYPTINTTVVSFAEPQTGKAILT